MAVKKGIKEGILDIGRYRPTKGSKLFAALKGVIDAGIECPYDEKKVPSEERLTGTHLNKEITPLINEIKTKIIGS
jgi:large subunit ribosomal protein L18